MSEDTTPTEYMLTTVDNPYDPFTQWNEWLAFDTEKGYHTPGMLARVAYQSDDLSETDQMLVVQQAIDEIVEDNFLGIYRKVSRQSSTSDQST